MSKTSRVYCEMCPHGDTVCVQTPGMNHTCFMKICFFCMLQIILCLCAITDASFLFTPVIKIKACRVSGYCLNWSCSDSVRPLLVSKTMTRQIFC